MRGVSSALARKYLKCVHISRLICLKLFEIKSSLYTTGQLIFILLYMSPGYVLWALRSFFFGGVLGSFFIQSFFLARARTIHLLFPPLYSSVLEPNFNLCFSQIKRGREVMSFGSHHVLLPIKFFFQSLKLFGCENCANSFRLSLLEIPGFVFFMVNNW